MDLINQARSYLIRIVTSQSKHQPLEAIHCFFSVCELSEDIAQLLQILLRVGLLLDEPKIGNLVFLYQIIDKRLLILAEFGIGNIGEFIDICCQFDSCSGTEKPG